MAFALVSSGYKLNNIVFYIYFGIILKSLIKLGIPSI